MTLSRIPRVLLSLAAILAIYLLLTMAHLMGAAHAAAGDPIPAQWSIELSTIVAVLIAFLTGVLALMGAAIKVLQVVAPRTTTTLDDRALVHLVDIKNATLAVAEALGRAVPPVPQPDPIPAVVKIPPSGTGALGVVAVCLLCAGAAMSWPACATVKQDTKAAGVAILDCTKQEAKPLEQALLDVVASAAKYILKLGAVDFTALGKEILADGREIAACAYAEYKAASAPPVTAIAHAIGPRVQDPVVAKYGSILTSRGVLQ